jgi:hypothetical protein
MLNGMGMSQFAFKVHCQTRPSGTASYSYKVIPKNIFSHVSKVFKLKE